MIRGGVSFFPSHLHTCKRLVFTFALRQEQAKYSKPIMTEVKPAAVFWPAEAYHQVLRGGGTGLCAFHCMSACLLPCLRT